MQKTLDEFILEKISEEYVHFMLTFFNIKTNYPSIDVLKILKKIQNEHK